LPVRYVPLTSGPLSVQLSHHALSLVATDRG
jgi:hypothetical protein